MPPRRSGPSDPPADPVEPGPTEPASPPEPPAEPPPDPPAPAQPEFDWDRLGHEIDTRINGAIGGVTDAIKKLTPAPPAAPTKEPDERPPHRRTGRERIRSWWFGG